MDLNCPEEHLLNRADTATVLLQTARLSLLLTIHTALGLTAEGTFFEGVRRHGPKSG